MTIIAPMSSGWTRMKLAVEAVRCEPVSAHKFPVNRENTGNFFDFCRSTGFH
jgi:hypothetical protein